MTTSRKVDKWLVVLVALHGVIACGGFLHPTIRWNRIASALTHAR